MTSVLQAATGGSYASGIIAFIGGLALSDWLAIFGALMVLVTYFTNLWFRFDDRRQRHKLYALRAKVIAATLDDNGDESP
ncbi:MAG: hypothetical protein BWK73_04590 [Thiothrix lacustris]|uniref:Holin n=1 Tax=Thiothrix lacustris TaxID=525917 RepID=A0A1Y1QXS2_9GAMM|nr:MAG: hypothetical protein BWK73_04590 [Thiothrix lacustris]